VSILTKLNADRVNETALNSPNFLSTSTVCLRDSSQRGNTRKVCIKYQVTLCSVQNPSKWFIPIYNVLGGQV